MFFKKNDKKEEPQYLNATVFIRLFCGLITPRIRAGKDIETAWSETNSYFETFTHESVMFEKAIKYKFSNEVVAAFCDLYEEPSEKSVYLNLLLVFHHCYKYNCSLQELADRLVVYEIENTLIPYSTEAYYPKIK